MDDGTHEWPAHVCSMGSDLKTTSDANVMMCYVPDVMCPWHLNTYKQSATIITTNPVG